MTPFLVTPRLMLRDFTADDLELLVELDSDPEVMRFISGGMPTPRQVLEEEHLPAWIAMNATSPGYGFWAAHDRSSGDFLGWFHLRPEPAPGRDPELGYRFHRAAWGRGLATEGSLALLAHAFADPRVGRVFAETLTVNRRSRAVMERIGMRHVRTFHGDWPIRIPGDEHGDVEYAVTREEWAARPSTAPSPVPRPSPAPHPPPASQP